MVQFAFIPNTLESPFQTGYIDEVINTLLNMTQKPAQFTTIYRFVLTDLIYYQIIPALYLIEKLFL